MIHVLGDQNDRITTEIVIRAFERSFTRGQVCKIQSGLDIPTSGAIVVAISPGEESAELLSRLIYRRGKVILHGSLNSRIRQLAGIEAVTVPPDLHESAHCELALPHETSVSRAALEYSDAGIGRASPLRRRFFSRFDFSNEWNNLGYGRIGFGDDRWSIAELANQFETLVASVEIDDASFFGAAATLRDLPGGSVLWFARPVGVVDGQDWAIVENFISSYRADELPCRPFLRGIPHGFGAGVSMRLDCDEDIASARPLFDLYRSRNRPMSLAIATGQRDKPENLVLLSDVLDAGGAILSHSVTHSPWWGGSEEIAEQEARDSKAHLETLVGGLNVRYAVSPFHQNPPYVPRALSRAGYDGFIGGSVANDPEYMMARAGVPPFGPANIVSHSQSCMLHGDCMLAGDDPLRVYKEAFRLSRHSSEFFGYLDHPFSERYAYGWPDEEFRVAVHSAYLDFLEAHSGAGPLLFVNEDTCMQFIKDKASAVITYDESSEWYSISRVEAFGFPMSIGYRGDIFEARYD